MLKYPKHVAHGDLPVGSSLPDMPGYKLNNQCEVVEINEELEEINECTPETHTFSSNNGYLDIETSDLYDQHWFAGMPEADPGTIVEVTVSVLVGWESATWIIVEALPPNEEHPIELFDMYTSDTGCDSGCCIATKTYSWPAEDFNSAADGTGSLALKSKYDILLASWHCQKCIMLGCVFVCTVRVFGGDSS